MRRRIATALIAGGLWASGHVPSVWAQAPANAEARAREIAHRAQEALRQSQDENLKLAADKAQVDQKLKAAEAELAAAKKVKRGDGGAAAQQQLKIANETIDGVTQQLRLTQQQLATQRAAAAESATALEAKQREIVQLQDALGKVRSDKISCEHKNAQLYAYGQSILKAYHDKGVWSALRQREPVLGLREVELQNQVQDYKDQMEAQKLPTTP